MLRCKRDKPDNVIFTIEEAIGVLNAGLDALGRPHLTKEELSEQVSTGLEVGFMVIEELGRDKIYQILGTEAFDMASNEDDDPLKTFHLNVAIEAVRVHLNATGGSNVPFPKADIGFLPIIVLIETDEPIP